MSRMQHKMTHISIHGTGVNSDSFRDTVDVHLEAMGMSRWELVSTNISEMSSFKNGYSVDALFFWKRPDQPPPD